MITLYGNFYIYLINNRFNNLSVQLMMLDDK